MTYSVRRALVVAGVALALGVFVGALFCETITTNGGNGEGENTDTAQDFRARYTPESARDLAVVTLPKPGAIVEFPILVRGEARGGWYFEATAPIDLVNDRGLIIGGGFVTAEGDWMTEDFVPFSGLLRLTNPQNITERGYLILHRNNASGLPEHDASVEIPVLIK